MQKKIIRLKDVTKYYKKHLVLSNISMDIHQGEIFGIIGLTGSGKTTLLNTIIGFIKPTYGDITFKQSHLLEYKGDEQISFRSVYKSEFELKRMFGFAAQQPSFYRKLTCEDNLHYFGSLYGLSKDIIRTNSEILLKLMGLYEFRKLDADELSGGMKKRLDIACSLIHDPHVLILDEPTADLDPITREKMWDLLKQINSKGTTVVLTSHYLEELEQLCDRVGILHNKRIVKVGTTEEIKDGYNQNFEIRIETRSRKYDNLAKYLRTSEISIENIKNEGRKLLIQTGMPEKALLATMEKVNNDGESIVDVSVTKPMLKEFLQKLIKTE